MDLTIEKKLNVSDTKKYYSKVNSEVLKGIEIITVKGLGKDITGKEEKVSHIKTEYVDFLMNQINFTPIIESGEEIGGYTVSVKELEMYGEGNTTVN